MKQFTDIYNFSLKCCQCGQALKGQNDAQSHAEATGHTQFQEFTGN